MPEEIRHLFIMMLNFTFLALCLATGTLSFTVYVNPLANTLSFISQPQNPKELLQGDPLRQPI